MSIRITLNLDNPWGGAVRSNRYQLLYYFSYLKHSINFLLKKLQAFYVFFYYNGFIHSNDLICILSLQYLIRFRLLRKFCNSMKIN